MLRAMADNGQPITAKQDATMYNIFSENIDFVFKGCGNELQVVATSGLTVQLKSGGCIICGRHVYEEQDENGTTTLQLSANSSGFIVIRYDLTKPAGNEAYLTITTAAERDDLNNGGAIRDLVLYEFYASDESVSLMDMRDIRKSPCPITFTVEYGKPYFTYFDGNKEVKKDLGSLDPSTLTATPSQVLSGAIFGGKDSDEPLTGTMKNNGAISKTITPSTSSQSYTIPPGYHPGTGKITVSAIQTQTKTVTPSTVQQVIKPDTGKFLSQVTVNAVPASSPDYIVMDNAAANVTSTGGTATSAVVDGGTTKKVVSIFCINSNSCTLQGSNDRTSWSNVGSINNSADSNNSSTNLNMNSGCFVNQNYRYYRVIVVGFSNGYKASGGLTVARAGA